MLLGLGANVQEMEIIFEKTAHPVLRNNTIFTGIVQAQPILIDGNRGIYTAQQLESKLDKFFGYNNSNPCLVSVENPTNYGRRSYLVIG